MRREDVRYGYWRASTPEPAGSGPTRVIHVDAATETAPVGAVFLRRALVDEGRFTLLTWTPSATTGRQQIALFRPNVAIVDADHLTDDHELLHELRRVAPDTKLLVHDRWQRLSQAEVTAAGADAYDTSDLANYTPLLDEAARPHTPYYRQHAAVKP